LGILGGIWSEEKNSGCGRSYFFTASWTVSSPRKKIIGGAKFSVLRVHKTFFPERISSTAVKGLMLTF
jgi:hypothetical protein